MNTLLNVAGWLVVIVFAASLVGLLLGGPAWLLAVTVAAAIALVFLTQNEVDVEDDRDEFFGQGPR